MRIGTGYGASVTNDPSADGRFCGHCNCRLVWLQGEEPPGNYCSHACRLAEEQRYWDDMGWDNPDDLEDD